MPVQKGRAWSVSQPVTHLNSQSVSQLPGQLVSQSVNQSGGGGVRDFKLISTELMQVKLATERETQKLTY